MGTKSLAVTAALGAARGCIGAEIAIPASDAAHTPCYSAAMRRTQIQANPQHAPRAVFARAWS